MNLNHQQIPYYHHSSSSSSSSQPTIKKTSRSSSVASQVSPSLNILTSGLNNYPTTNTIYHQYTPTTSSSSSNSKKPTNHSNNMLSLYSQPATSSSSSNNVNLMHHHNSMFNMMMGSTSNTTTTTSASSLHPSSSSLTFSSSSSSDESTSNQNLANLLSNLMSLNPQSPTSILLDNLTNSNNNSTLGTSNHHHHSQQQTSFPHVHYPSQHVENSNKMNSSMLNTNKMTSPRSSAHPLQTHQQTVSNLHVPFHNQHGDVHEELRNKFFPTSTSSSTSQEKSNNGNSMLKSFDDQAWSCMDFKNSKNTSSNLIKPPSPSSFKDDFTFMLDELKTKHAVNNNQDLSLSDVITVSDLFQSNNTNATCTDANPTIFSMYGISSLSEMKTSELITPMEYSNSTNLLQKQQVVDYYSSLLQSRFQQVFGNAILEDSNNQTITTQQFVYYNIPSSNELYRKPLNLKLDLSDSDVEIMRSIFGKQHVNNNHLTTVLSSNQNRKSIQAMRKNSICSSGSSGKQITKPNKTKGSPSRKGRKCQAVPNNFSPLNEETGNWRFFSYNGDVKEPFSLDQEESPSKLVFYKFNPVK